MVEGSCLCGAVRFAIDGWVSPLQYCHCQRCQKASGGAFVAAVAASMESFRWLQGDDLVGVFALPVRSEPPPYRTAFCRRCGAPVPIADPERPFAVIPAGALDVPRDVEQVGPGLRGAGPALLRGSQRLEAMLHEAG